MSQDNQNNSKRYLANIIEQSGRYGTFEKALINNINQTNEDGTPNKYHQGHLLWLDALTGHKYLVQQMKVQVNKNGKKSLVLDISDSYHVKDLG